ncbi:hypothetical protein CDAR_599711 [Caerostris darwini]|uniref:Galectin n=1 Tax=Caerostris darwini TaxID=1538125 RepID=A0AAV4R902_9ARAC|nr:hypothetical protein CDAR_599711 [Caerostris darwini]
MDSNIYNPSIPFIGPLPRSLQTGNIIKISGVVNSSATCFSINLQNGSNSYQRSDISLHLSPVFSSPPRIVRNCLENQQWGPEESHGPQFPLIIGQGFEILILAESDHFKIAVNGAHFTEFSYRLPLQSISHIAVDGDVTINSIKFEGLATTPMQGSGEGISKPLGFMIDPSNQGNLAPPPSSGRPPSPYDTSSMPYPTSFGPSPTSYNPPSGGNYNQNSPSSPYGPSGGYNYGIPPSGGSPYGPPPSGNPYGPPGGNPYGPPSGNPYGPPSGNPYGPPGGNPYPSPQGYPGQSGNYPSQGYPTSNPYPGQAGPYPGTSVVYPGQEKKSESGLNLGPLAAAGAAALAGVAGSTIMGKKHKKKKHGHGLDIPGMGHGLGPAALMGGVSSFLGGDKHGHGHKSGTGLAAPLAGGAAALAGAYMLSKSPVGKMMKPKKMKKLYKHKGGWGSSSSSSSSSSD